MTTQNYDVVIVGAGIVGAAFAAALRDSGLNLALVEQHPPEPPTDDWDTRIYAISPGSAALLENLGVWQTLDQSRNGPVYGMSIRGDSGAELEFDAYRAGVPQLAWIMESGRIQHGLWAALQNQDNLTLYAGASCSELAWSAFGARLALGDGTVLHSKLVVAADGRQSWVRAQAGIASRREDYLQSGVVANFVTEQAHRGIARQWFREDGVLAWLPLPDNHISMVWSTDAEHTKALMAASPEQLAEEVGRAGGYALGKLCQLGTTAAFPLSINRVSTLVKPGLALIGDAAHGVHPLAGQGVNLGLRDARELANVLLQRGAAGCGELALLRRYERARLADIAAMQTVTDSLHHLFRSRNPMLAKLRNIGMDFTNQLTPVKTWLMRQALG
ncbi:MAG: UbiH/UbiF family hydroxylase [Sulfuriferula sp.]|nr:UbiH/UbiF family hydroxylase [Sulfuriferula sp.]